MLNHSKFNQKSPKNLKNGPIYQDLIDLAEATFSRREGSSATFANMRSTLRRFLDVISKSPVSPVEDDFGDQYESRKSTFLQSFEQDLTHQLSKSTVASHSSHLNRWKEIFDDFSRPGKNQSTFSMVLQSLARENAVSIKQLAEVALLRPVNLENWARGLRFPTHEEHFEGLKRIEKAFNLSEGFLKSHIPWSRRPKEKSRPRTEYSKKIKNLKSDPYRYRRWHAALNEEWALLCAEREVNIQLISSSQSKWRPATKRFHFETVSSFFGFLLNKRVKTTPGIPDKFKPEDMSLALLSDHRLVLECVDYQVTRVGRITHSQVTLLRSFLLFLKPVSGFIWRRPDLFAGRLKYHPIDESKWQDWCKSAHEILKVYARNVLKNKTQGRDPVESVKKILALNQPISALIEMDLNMQSQLPNIGGLDLKALRPTQLVAIALAYRDCILIKLLSSNPLRRSHFQIMTYRSDNSGHLYQNEQKQWFLRFEPHEFKNEKGAARHAYSAPIPKVHHKILETWLFDIYPLLSKPKDCDKVFLSATLSKQTFHPITNMTLYTRVQHLTSRYCKLAPAGFGPHAFRHIVATDYILNHECNFMAAAHILHDTLRTVMAAYAHLNGRQARGQFSAYYENVYAQTKHNLLKKSFPHY